MPSAIYNAGDVVIIPFPFADNIKKAKRRPVAIISPAAFNRKTGTCICAMITSSNRAAWPHDVAIRDVPQAGLSMPCLIRMKLFTLDLQLILRRTGHLAKSDKAALKKSLALVTHLHD